MTHPEDPPLFDPITDAELDRAFARLPRADFDPIAQRVVLVAAERRLAGKPYTVSRVERCEPALLVALSTAHLVWLVLRLLASSG